MKSKNPNAFWFRWLGMSSLHGIIYTAAWLSDPWFHLQWYGALPFTFLGGLLLSVLQYKVMPETMRPDAKRWFLSSLFGQIVASIIHLFMPILMVETNPMLMITALYLPLAIAQSWALGERFKKSWLFGIAMMAGALIFAIRPSFYNNTYLFIYEVITFIIMGFLMGESLMYLQKYQRKEATSINTAYERLAIREEKEATLPDESIALAQQKMS